MLTTFHYIKYFFYIAFNWNIRLAVFSIYHEIKGEKKYQINTSRLDRLTGLNIQSDNRKEAEIYQGASYYLLERIFSRLQQMNANDHIIDLGCGKGRVMVVAAYFGFNSITGIDFAKTLCLQAEQNCMVITKRFPLTSWQVLHEDAANFKFKKSDQVLFLFNPFKEPVMKKVIGNILESLKKYPRRIIVTYMNPQHKRLFIEAGFTEIYYLKRMEYVDVVLLEKIM